MVEKNIYWSLFTIDKKTFLFAATNDGLCYVKRSDEPFLPFKKWTQKNLPTYSLHESESMLANYKSELEHYFQGDLSQFTAPLTLYGTPFQINVWHALQSIPYSQTETYSDIAEAIGKPTAVRAVASAIGANPLLIFVPCHRVIGKDGSLTGFSSGIDLKKQLLTLENNL